MGFYPITPMLGNRHLIRELVLRDIRSRYVGSYFGLAWSIVNPLVHLAVYTFVAYIFTRKADIQADPLELGAVIFAGLMPWIAFQEALSRGAASFVENANLIKKLRFPLPVLPFQVVLSSTVHQLIGLGIFILVLAFAGRLAALHLALLPLLVLVQVALAFGISLAAACLHVFVRDTAQFLNLALLALFWGTPIVYQRSIAPSFLGLMLGLNPLTHMVEAYRWALLGSPPPSWPGLAYWGAASALALLLGLLVLHRTRRELVDFI